MQVNRRTLEDSEALLRRTKHMRVKFSLVWNLLKSNTETEQLIEKSCSALLNRRSAGGVNVKLLPAAAEAAAAHWHVKACEWSASSNGIE